MVVLQPIATSVDRGHSSSSLPTNPLTGSPGGVEEFHYFIQVFLVL